MYFTHPQFKSFSLKPFFKGFSGFDLKNKLSKIFPDSYFLFTNSGRSAFQVAIKELNLENSEMVFPAYICDIFKPILEQFHIKPIYIDVNLKTFNFQIDNIEKQITSNTKSILVCHTYGYPNDMKRIKELAQKYNLKIIEDCARAFGIKHPSTDSGQIYLGNFGDCAIFSLPKFLPSANGGILVSKRPINIKLNNPKLRLKTLIKFMRLFPVFATITEKFRIKENTIKTIKPGMPRMASGLSLRMLNWHLDTFEEQLNQRSELIQYFKQELGKNNIYIPEQTTYVSALIPGRNKLLNRLRKHNIYCSRTWHNPLYPDLPNARKASEEIINFPLQNWFTKKDIDKIISDILLEMD
jgi:dTDP-4-amino-4,6-dideoxygalactose transaminase